MEIADRLLYSTKMLTGALDWICEGESAMQRQPNAETVKTVAEDLLNAAEYFMHAGNTQASVENYWLAGYLFEKLGSQHDSHEPVRRIELQKCGSFSLADPVFAAFVFCHKIDEQRSVVKIEEVREEICNRFGDDQEASTRELYKKLNGYCDRRTREFRRLDWEWKMVQRCMLFILEGDECVERHEISVAAGKYQQAQEILKYQLNMPNVADDMSKKRIKQQYIKCFGALPTFEEIEAANWKARSS